MRFLASTPFLTVLVLSPAAQATSALTLTTLQPINGFDTACTNAYNTPLTDCSNSDFSGQGCSAKCIGFLDDLSKSLNEDCAGTSAYRSTLIGLFFANEGVQTICSNAGGSSSSSDGQGVAYAGQSGAASTSSTSASTSSTTSSSTTSTPQAAATTSTSSTPQAAATSSTTIGVAVTVTPEPTTTSVAIVGTTVIAESPSDASSSTSSTTRSTSSSSTSTSTNSGNGGGTPLDTGSSACHDAAVSGWLFALVAGSASVAWLL